MRMRKLFLFLCICLLFVGCGKETNKVEHDHSKWEVDKCFTEDALLYKNSFTRRVEYFDYQTGHYGPLCGKPNCLHEDSECMACYLWDAIVQMGRLGDKWYYVKLEDDGTQAFCSCDLDGTNEKEIGEFPHRVSYKGYFYEDSCIFLTEDAVFDEKDGEWLGDISGIYQYHLDTGEAEVLCPEKDIMTTAAYRLYGQYENKLIYGERMGEGLKLRIMDLKTHEIQTPLEDRYVYDGTVNDGFLVCGVSEGEGSSLIEYNLESGEWKKVMGDEKNWAMVCWSSDLKLVTVFNGAMNQENFRYEIYQYMEDGECVLVREGDRETYLEPVAIKDDQIIGRYGDAGDDNLRFELAVIRKEDFFAGKCNWEVLQY